MRHLTSIMYKALEYESRVLFEFNDGTVMLSFY